MAADEHVAASQVLTALSEGQRSQALRRWRILRPHVEDALPLARAAADAGVPERTAQRWLARYRAEGLAGLARSARADRGRRRFPTALVALVEGLALRRPAPTAAQVHHQVAAVAAGQGWPVPAYGTVYAIIRGIDPAMCMLAHEGTKRFREVYELVHRRTADRPNDIWQADHTQLDPWVVTPSAKPARPWLTVIEDDYFRAIAGYAVNLGARSALQTALARRQATWCKTEPRWHICGIPSVLYIDHGSDFTSRHLEQVMAGLHIRAVFSLQGQRAAAGRSSATWTPSTRCAWQHCPDTRTAALQTAPGRRR
jgi:putative transposase